MKSQCEKSIFERIITILLKHGGHEDQEVLQREHLSNDHLNSQLITEINPSKNIFESFKKDHKTETISVLDTFAGGGSIPFESALHHFFDCKRCNRTDSTDCNHL